MMKVVMYSTHCPKCKVLAMKLAQKGIEFEEIDNLDEMRRIGLKSAPALRIEGNILGFNEAIEWLKRQ